MRALLAELEWADETAPGTVYAQMGLDEVALERAEVPWGRVYRWTEPAATIGCSTRVEEVKEALGGRPWTRRLTGGGVVWHDTDLTYSLVVPRDFMPVAMRAREWYEALHSRLAAALENPVHLAQADLPGPTDWCFRRPVQHDLLDVTGEKRAGAALRFTRRGLLVQGSIRGGGVDWGRFIGSVASEVRHVEVSADWKRAASWLAQRRYDTDDWRYSKRRDRSPGASLKPSQ